ncbi:MAG: hypothetical protein EOP53_18610 [Sphingobacteriales bacterium]|nr:MAG: hypothetical protein EOP53_18610 [Sphingobacteriales bacterium]
MIDSKPFDIEYLHNGSQQRANIQPCCKENNIVDYAVWQNGKLHFTITRDMVDKHHWSIAIKNADDDFDEEMIQNIGAAIEYHQRN